MLYFRRFGFRSRKISTDFQFVRHQTAHINWITLHSIRIHRRLRCCLALNNLCVFEHTSFRVYPVRRSIETAAWFWFSFVGFWWKNEKKIKKLPEKPSIIPLRYCLLLYKRITLYWCRLYSRKRCARAGFERYKYA